jgi:hypothetical protein
VQKTDFFLCLGSAGRGRMNARDVIIAAFTWASLKCGVYWKLMDGGGRRAGEGFFCSVSGSGR